MPPKAKFTRKEIIKKAIDLAKREGMEGLTARELGKEMESSARPIFTVFESMNEVKDAVRAYAKDTYLQYTGMGLKQENALEGYCMAHIIFAMKEPKLFDILFLGDTTKKTNALMMQGEERYCKSVYDARFNSGRLLAKAYPVDADIAVGVPESGITGAAGYAAEAGIPFALAFQKNSYMGRTFIKPTQSERESAVHMKLNVIDSVVKGKKVVLIDDSIVRGTTMKNLIKMLRKAGATEVHVRVSSPPFLHPCYYGTDVPDNAQLIANLMTQDEIREMIGADSLGYMKVEDLDKMVPGLSFCKACFNGEYPTPV